MEQEQAPYEHWIGLPLSEWKHEISLFHRQLLQDFLAVARRSNVSMESIKEGGVNMTSDDWDMRSENEHSVRPLQRAYFALWRVAQMIQEGPEVHPRAFLEALRAAHDEIRSAEGRIADEYQGEAVNLQRAMMAEKATKRHAGHARAQKLAEQYWWEQKGRYKSMNHAGRAVAAWLRSELKREDDQSAQVADKKPMRPPTDRTVTDWLRACAKSRCGSGDYYRKAAKI